MADNEVLNKALNGNDDQVMFLYIQLMNTPYSQINIISEIEHSLYSEMSKNSEDNLILIALMQIQTMLGNHEKSKAFAYKIWEKGNQLAKMEEYYYINNLMNLGLLDMASVLLKPKFANLMENIELYYPLMIKIAVMTGNVTLIDRLSSNPLFSNEEELLKGIVSKYKNYNYIEHFKAVQKIILEQIPENLCAYEFDVVSDILDEMRISVYLTGDNDTKERLKREIEERLSAYYTSANIEKLSNYSWDIKHISEHPAEGFDI